MKLGLFVLEFHTEGFCDELLYLPVCSFCDEPITNLEEGNIIADYGPLDRDLPEAVPAGTLAGVLLKRQPLQGIDAYHLTCDRERNRTRFTGWGRLSTLFKTDQRFRPNTHTQKKEKRK